MESQRPAYRFESLDIRYIREISTVDLAPVVEELSHDFLGLVLHRDTFRTAAGGPGMPETAVAFILGAAAVGFLRELGKDAYQKARDLLWDLYRKWRDPDTPSGRFEPMSVIVGRGGAGVYFVLGTGLTEEEFRTALATMGPAAESVVSEPGDREFPWWFEFRFDAASGEWRSVHEGSGGRVVRDEQNAEPSP